KKAFRLRFPKNSHSVPPARPIQPLNNAKLSQRVLCDSPSRKAEKNVHLSLSFRIGQEEESG
ncbi:hypothetical protein B0H65DRAFT_521520, partial [Neurospora tetraspora]